GVFDIIRYPISDGRELFRAIDRAAELNYFIYMNEQLKDQSGAARQLSATTDAMFSVWLKESQKINDRAGAIENALKEISRHYESKCAFFMKFIESSSALVV